MIRRNLAILIAMISFCTTDQSYSQENPDCVISPRYLTFEFPARGFITADDDSYEDSCVLVPDSIWMKLPDDSLGLRVAVDGPHGSGRYWTVTIGKTNPDGMVPDRGIYLQTTTVGWRTLQYFNNLPLPWLGDMDADGLPEVIIWDSFPLHSESSLAEFGLVAWVYELDSDGVLNLNWQLSRQQAAEIAKAYRENLNNSDERLQKRRNEIAGYLENFALKKCDN